jgi:hypothetical protein
MWLLSQNLAALLADINIDMLAKMLKVSTNSAEHSYIFRLCFDMNTKEAAVLQIGQLSFVIRLAF